MLRWATRKSPDMESAVSGSVQKALVCVMSNVQRLLGEVRERFTAYLEERGLRKTRERYAVLEEVYKTSGHLDVDTLYTRLRSSGLRLSRATVYNTLDLLVACDLVKRHQFGQHQGLYEKSFGSRQHDHLICLDCNMVSEFCDPRLQGIQDTAGNLLRFQVVSHSLVLYGNCQNPDCANRKSERG